MLIEKITSLLVDICGYIFIILFLVGLFNSIYANLRYRNNHWLKNAPEKYVKLYNSLRDLPKKIDDKAKNESFEDFAIWILDNFDEKEIKLFCNKIDKKIIQTLHDNLLNCIQTRKDFILVAINLLRDCVNSKDVGHNHSFENINRFLETLNQRTIKVNKCYVLFSNQMR